MGKVGEADFAELRTRLRARALDVMAALERAPDAAPVSDTRGGRASPPRPETGLAPTARLCAACQTENDSDARFCKQCGGKLGTRWRRALGLALGVLLTSASAASAQAPAQMPNPKEMSGIVRPDDAVPVGAMTVRVIRGSFDKNLAGQPVEFIDRRREAHGADRCRRPRRSCATCAAAPRCAPSRSSTASGWSRRKPSSRAAPGSACCWSPPTRRRRPPPRRAPPAPIRAEPGTVVFGDSSRVIAELSNERLNIYYALDIVNGSSSHVDIGGPLVIELPTTARGATVMQGSTPQATAKGAHVIVTGPVRAGIDARADRLRAAVRRSVACACARSGRRR